MNRKVFFDKIRKSLFDGKLKQSQVAGFTVILDYAEKSRTNIEYLSYILATTYHETAFTMQPISERGSASYLQGKKYWPYIGRGYVQLTWKTNYKKAGQKLGLDLFNNPRLAMQPDIAVRILFAGMEEGWFTGKKLSSYMDGIDGTDAEDRQQYKLSRWLINGKDKRNEIAEHALKFEHALRSAQSAPKINPPDNPRQNEEEAPSGQKTGLAGILINIIETILRMLKK